MPRSCSAHRRRRCPTRDADAGSADAAVSQQLGDQYAGEICPARPPVPCYPGGAEGQSSHALAREVPEEFPTPVARQIFPPDLDAFVLLSSHKSAICRDPSRVMLLSTLPPVWEGHLQGLENLGLLR